MKREDFEIKVIGIIIKGMSWIKIDEKSMDLGFHFSQFKKTMCFSIFICLAFLYKCWFFKKGLKIFKKKDEKIIS